MKSLSRRNFVRLSAAAAAITSVAPAKMAQAARPYPGGDVGIYVSLNTQDVEETFKKITKLGFTSCEIYTGKYSMDLAKPLKEAIEKYNMKVLALFTLGPGKNTWDFYEGQNNIGLVSREYREARVDAMFQLSDLASACGVDMIETHVGYIPENPNDPVYGETIEALKRVVGYCKKNNQVFLYHAGQESPTTMLRTILDVGFDNQGIGMDTANLIMYDRGHPTYSLEVYGKYIKLVNAKDGVYPVDPKNLGREVPLGQGKVDFPVFIRKLKESGYNGPVIIEREASRGEQWEIDVTRSREFLRVLLNS
ncbi:MAG: sugar phosphate isomerase/epimerase [Prolixibacteraceae bacterium]|nr:sugar phosphate isomerase/epimerase [Prolixibacteraceae bacterium]